jgi:hypothetical protein
MRNLFIFLSLLTSLFSFSQKTEKLPLRKYKIAVLSDSLKETSGLTFLKDKLYTFNDSGNTNEIFEIDKNSGKILKKFKLIFQIKIGKLLQMMEKIFTLAILGIMQEKEKI